MTRSRFVVEAKGLVHAERYTASGNGTVDCRATSGPGLSVGPLASGGVQSSWRRPDRVYIKRWAQCGHMGPSIKYVMLFLPNFDPPPPCHTLSHIPGPPKSTSHISDPPI